MQSDSFGTTPFIPGHLSVTYIKDKCVYLFPFLWKCVDLYCILLSNNSLCVFWFSYDWVCQLGTACFPSDAYRRSVWSGISTTCLPDTSWRPGDSLHGKPLFRNVREGEWAENNRAGLGAEGRLPLPKLSRLLTSQTCQFSSICMVEVIIQDHLDKFEFP